MAKYRILTLEELQGLEKEFVDFLILNGILADDWTKIKEQDVAEAERIIELFSDVVFEGILRKVQFLEYRSKSEIRCFQCLPDKILLVGIKSGNDHHVDFTDAAFLKQALEHPPASIKIFSTEKNYSKERETEIFEMTLADCLISDGKMFKTLSLAMTE